MACYRINFYLHNYFINLNIKLFSDILGANLGPSFDASALLCAYWHINRYVGLWFGPKKDGVTGEWRKLHNEELNSLYSSPNIV